MGFREPDSFVAIPPLETSRAILGWDVGGANVKAARIEPGQRVARVVEQPFPLWREPQRLSQVLRETAARLGDADVMAVTMTAELADCFAAKRDGVACVVNAFERSFPGRALAIYGVDGRFRSADEARREPHVVAAANWMASATVAARTFRDALFVDVGSTTADVIPIAGGRVVARGCTDPERLRSGELVYTGALRTPCCAIARWVPLGGRRCRVAAELFAIAADVHVWLGHIDEGDYTCEPPDGRGRTRAEAAARLARMVCADLETIDAADVTAIAEHLARAQTRQIASGIRQIVRRLGPDAPRVAVLAGVGRFLGRAAAEEAGLAVIDLATALGEDAARATPAAAVAYLLAEARDSEGRRKVPGGAAGLQNRSGGRKVPGGFDSLPSPPCPRCRSGLASTERLGSAREADAPRARHDSLPSPPRPVSRGGSTGPALHSTGPDLPAGRILGTRRG